MGTGLSEPKVRSSRTTGAEMLPSETCAPTIEDRLSFGCPRRIGKNHESGRRHMTKMQDLPDGEPDMAKYRDRITEKVLVPPGWRFLVFMALFAAWKFLEAVFR